MSNWTLVENKSKKCIARKQHSLKITSSNRNLSSSYDEIIFKEDRLAYLISLVDTTLETLSNLCSEFVTRVLHAIEIRIQRIAGETDHAHLLCYGIGCVSQSPAALLQFSLAVLIKRSLHLQTATCFDPLFSKYDIEICKRFDFSVETVNSRGKYFVRPNTVAFMPHCPHRLYCNLLWSNRSQLNDIIIIGNSFESYNLRRINEKNNTDIIRLLESLTQEISIWTEDDRPTVEHPSLSAFSSAFNDLSAIIFSDGYDILEWPQESEIDEASSADQELL